MAFVLADMMPCAGKLHGKADTRALTIALIRRLPNRGC